MAEKNEECGLYNAVREFLSFFLDLLLSKLGF